MTRRIVLSSVLAVSLCATSAFAADVKKHLPIESTKKYSSIQSVYESDIAVYWKGQSHPKVKKNRGTYKTSKRTNGFMKENEASCAHALASALIVLQQRARKEGGNAVIDIISNVHNIEEASATEYTCLVGSMMVNVALKGTVATL
ncbi:excinuclease ABC subunit A [Desulfosediminicola flagellatus]|uniref:excinuclease ABC subunit A n=1 Tax=Desulfosediminicola flagellatus TaxID=2569541 RepID=UPI0010AD78E6|nr:excinuclease ABC subunit A [Desulfosediminicola flagellatus]